MNSNSDNRKKRQISPPLLATLLGAGVGLVLLLAANYAGGRGPLGQVYISFVFISGRHANTFATMAVLYLTHATVGGLLGLALWGIVRGLRRSRLPTAVKAGIAIVILPASLAISTVLLSFSLLTWANYVSLAPSDDALIANFQRNRGTLDQIEQMLQKTPSLVNIRTDIPSDTALPAGTIRTEEAQYRLLLESAGITQASFGGDGDSRLWVWSEGWVFSDGADKGYYYSKTRPSPMIRDLDDVKPRYDSTYDGYRPITGNWYLYYSHTPG